MTKDEQTSTVTATETPSASPAPVANKANKGSKKKAVVKTKSAKKPAKKPAKKTKKANVSPQAQSASAIEGLSFDKLNKDEKKIVKAVYSAKGERKAFSIKEIMTATKLKTSPVRNALRRPVRGRWLEPVDRGTYRLTEAGRKRGIPKNA